MSNLEIGETMVKPVTRKPWQTFLTVLPMLLFSWMMLSQGNGIDTDSLKLIPLLVTYFFVNIIFILMVHTGKTDKYRSILFVTYAVCFVLSFIPNLLEVRGSNVYTPEDIIQGKIPFCHIVIPMTVIPAALTKTIIFPGSLLEGFASIGSMIIIWLGASLALGRGFCSWGCFYGGLEDGFARIGKKPFLKKIDPKWRYLSYAVLLAVVLTSLATLSPTYCIWLCPFKAVTEFEKISSVLVLIQTIIFASLFVGLVMVLPMLTKKRTQCSFLCPMGAFQSFTNKVDPFEIRIDREKCSHCGLCINVCPTFSMDEVSLAKGKANLSCTKCGKCIDRCPKKAISLGVKGSATAGNRGGGARLIFLYPAFMFLVTFSGGMIQDAIRRVLMLLTTGKFIQM
ncbi:MAG: 4Fe-4S binding protein [Bacteroidota bacterium]